MRCRRLRFDPWVKRILWRRKWQPTPVCFPGQFHGQTSLAGCSPWGRKNTRLSNGTARSPLSVLSTVSPDSAAGGGPGPTHCPGARGPAEPAGRQDRHGPRQARSPGSGVPHGVHLPTSLPACVTSSAPREPGWVTHNGKESVNKNKKKALKTTGTGVKMTVRLARVPTRPC